MNNDSKKPFYVCKTCDYGYDPKTSQEITDWRVKYGAESFEAVVVQHRKPKGIIDKFLHATRYDDEGIITRIRLCN